MMKRQYTFLVVVALVALACLVSRGEDFKWAWNEGDAPAEKPAAEGATKPAQPARGAGSFDWSWDGAAEKAPGEGGTVTPATPAPIDTAEYDRLLKDNLELRKKIADALKDEEAKRQDNARLAAQLKGMEERLQQFARDIDRLEKEKAASVENLDRVVALETELKSTEATKARLAESMEALKAQMAALQEGAALAPVRSPKVQPGSDLFKQIEAENAQLKARLADIEAERAAAEKARMAALESDAQAKAEVAQIQEDREELAGRLAETRSAEERQRKTVGRLMKTLPGLEDELADLRSEVATKDAALRRTEQNLAALKAELLRREHRIVKAERMADVLQEAREELRVANDVRLRDMHFNMASVYAKEGRSRDAEREYLSALRIDPADADTHYNLGILYDDDLDDEARAAMHYRRYLRLRPHGEDVDQVKSWLLELEMAD